MLSVPALRYRQAQQTGPSQAASCGPEPCLPPSPTTQWKTLAPRPMRKLAVPATGTLASLGSETQVQGTSLGQKDKVGGSREAMGLSF